jgi:hypothetical protein
MQQQARTWGIDLAPHGKTTMSPQLFRRQLDAGAWGLTFATVTQLAVGVAAGARRTVIANQVLSDADLAGIQALLRAHPGLRIVFLVDSSAQLDLIEDGSLRTPGACRSKRCSRSVWRVAAPVVARQAEAAALARRLHASAAVRLVGIECYEGLGAKGNTADDAPYASALMDRVEAIARLCDAEKALRHRRGLLSAGGSAIFDLVATRLRPALGRPLRGLLRSGCYVTHDHGFYKRFVNVVNQRCGCDDGPAARARGLGDGAVATRARSRHPGGGAARPVVRHRAADPDRPGGAGRARAVRDSGELEDHRPERPARVPALGRRRRRQRADGGRTHRARASRIPARRSTSGNGCRSSTTTTGSVDALVTHF